MCMICRSTPCKRGCPNYSPRYTRYLCCVCGDAIACGEEYIANEDGEYMHYDCIPSTRDLLNWLDYDVQCVSEDDDDF